MKNILKSISLAAGCLLAGAALQSCALDQPFGNEGDGVLQMKLVINSDVTRAENDEDALRENCVVYISNTKGLIHKFQGLENVPDQIDMKAGHYVAEAWTGDSVSASFDKKFFRGYQPFDIESGVNQVVLNCKIRNVVVSINAEALKAVPMTDYNIKVENSRGSLDFTVDNFETAKGYFMMPNGESTLKLTVTGKNDVGQEFTKVQEIENVESAHEYVLNIAHNPTYEETGGSFLTITVDSSEVLVESEVEIFGRPDIKGSGFEIDKQIYAEQGAFPHDMTVKVKCFGGLANLVLSTSENDYEALHLNSDNIDLVHCTDEVKERTRNAGLTWEGPEFNEATKLYTTYLTFSSAFLNNIPERNTEYRINIKVTDTYGKVYEQPLRIAVGEGAIVIDDPVTVTAIDQNKDLMAVATTTATITGSIVSADAVNPGIEYRVADSTDNWIFVPVPESALRAMTSRRGLPAAKMLKAPGKTFTVTLTGLKPNTRYEYRAVADGFASDVCYITTEGKFAIPNGGLEIWGTYKGKVPVFNTTKDIVIPGDAGNQENSFWSSGNQGAAAASMVLTDKFADVKHGGQYSARLETKSALGVIAAGNMFSGIFDGTEDGTNGILKLGREFDGTHPKAVRVWVNYRPGGNCTVDKDSKDLVDIKEGGSDHGQIYVALTTGTVEIHTSPKRRQLMSPDRDEVLAYGQVTWTENFGSDGQLEMVDIPFEYNSKASTVKPTHIVIVCAASKFGDFFSGCAGSTMIVDDFELVYE